MPAWNNVTIPETPSATFVQVKNISLQSSEKTVKDFFSFCGKLKQFELTTDDDGAHQVAVIEFERESAAKTAILLSDALLDNCHIHVSSYFEESSSNESEKSVEAHDQSTTHGTETPQESKAKSRIAAEILAHGYLLQDQVVAKGLAYDHKYGFSNRFTGYLSALQSSVKTFDEKYRIWDKALEIDQKYKIQEKVQNAAQTALQTPTGQKVHGLANQTFAQVAAVHYEAKKIQSEKLLKETNTAATETQPQPSVAA
ncbi:uncharacterized protein BYT42DRAFT_564618 [Radiomyces spectabilis]|uniref:uncharacterized protein n=1 Tax=Radiomyces spectabilis TaxID=64574 RepID=UPI00221ED1E4|nr:uncharacterized protein BYT42DRAFT_564618 [Radiomyces spectabilis]KAI8380900.1 hypothetical protein BYT42DRAFT_564618 [Radiomyces spectabilis]